MPATATASYRRPRRLPATQGRVDAGERLQFDCQGFVILRGVLDLPTIQTLTDEFDRLAAFEHDDSGWRADHGMPTRSVFGDALRLSGLPRLSPAFDDLIGHPAIMPYLDEFVADPVLVNTWAIDKQPGTGAIGWHSGLAPHQHYREGGRSFTAMLNTIWALDRNDPDSGCPIALPGSHRRCFEPERRYELLDLPGSIPVILDPGDVFVFSEATLHGGLPRHAPGSRKNLYINYVEGSRNAAGNADGNLHHRWLPPEVRARFPADRQHLFAWMETCAGA